MAKPEVALIDYGVGNMLNVARALDYIGATVRVVEAGDEAIKADHLVLPGVGSFPDAMHELTARRLREPIVEFAKSGRPMLGICLGMQMLLDKSSEFGETAGLGLIPGGVERIPDMGASGKRRKIPHIGWNRIVPSQRDLSRTVFANLPPNPDMYFVHSFMAVPHDDKHRLADYDYDGCLISAAVQRENVLGCQFHPEKSGAQGLEILKSFVRT
jgi:glutamine amidotransferase